MKAQALIAALALLVPLASRAEDACDHGGNAAESAPAGKAPLVVRGDKLPESSGVALADVLAAPQKYDGKTALVEGTVRRACSRMGCWMELASSETSPGMRITFKDGGFFVPTDSAGARARVQGVVKVAEVSPEKAAHLAKEGATVPAGADGKIREVEMVASGVELRR